MTELKKPVRRTAILLTDHRIKPRDGDRIIITLYPDQTIGFRQYRTRREYRLPLATCFKMAVLAEAEAKKKAKRISRGLLK